MKNIRHTHPSSSIKDNHSNHLLRSSKLCTTTNKTTTITTTTTTNNSILLHNKNRCYVEDFIAVQQHQQICLLIPTHGNKELKCQFMKCIKHISPNIVSLFDKSKYLI